MKGAELCLSARESKAELTRHREVPLAEKSTMCTIPSVS